MDGTVRKEAMLKAGWGLSGPQHPPLWGLAGHVSLDMFILTPKTNS